ncbi:MAG: PPC domain-containing protein, partial [Pirellula sp.]
DSNELDVFKIQLTQGMRVTIDCSAGRLDSMLDGTLAVVDAQGKQLAASSDYFGRDPMIDFIAPASGDYWIVLHDLSFRGGMPYRLMVTARPYVENVFPRVVQEGKDVNFKVLGRNLGATSIATNKELQDVKLFEAGFTGRSPANVLEFGKFVFL